MRASPLAILGVLAALLIGCGGSGGGASTAGSSEGAAASAKQVRATWEHKPACARPQGASRWGCSVGLYRCQAVVTGRGWSVDCSKPGRAVAFIVKPG